MTSFNDYLDVLVSFADDTLSEGFVPFGWEDYQEEITEAVRFFSEYKEDRANDYTELETRHVESRKVW